MPSTFGKIFAIILGMGVFAAVSFFIAWGGFILAPIVAITLVPMLAFFRKSPGLKSQKLPILSTTKVATGRRAGSELIIERRVAPSIIPRAVSGK